MLSRTDLAIPRDKLPPLPTGINLENANGPVYLWRWNQYWDWTKTDEFKSQMRAMVDAPDFLEGNYLSSELRTPATLLGINACSPIATNALRDNIWDNFSSESYKTLPSVGTIKIRHPVTGEEMDYPLTGGGRGYIRPASLVSVWSTAPFLQNNTVGDFDGDPSVAARMRRFDQAIEQLLWPEKRKKDKIFTDPGPGVGVIDRMTAASWLDIAPGYVPDYLRPLVSVARHLLPFIAGAAGSLSIGPLPEGTPVGLLTNMDLLGEEMTDAQSRDHRKRILNLLKDLKARLKAGQTAPFDKALTDEMLAVSKCKDLVVNKGHYFGTDYFKEEPGLSDADKRALIAFLKTF